MMTTWIKWKVGEPIIFRIRINFAEERKKAIFRRINKMLSH